MRNVLYSDAFWSEFGVTLCIKAFCALAFGRSEIVGGNLFENILSKVCLDISIVRLRSNRSIEIRSSGVAIVVSPHMLCSQNQSAKT